MPAGLPVDKQILDQRAGTLAWQFREMLEDLQTLKLYLDGKTDSELKAAPFSYTQDDVDTLRAAYTAFDKLARVAHGQDVVEDADDFFFHARKLIGLQ
jgi:hypothetical protein